jgi:hypothetical protein
MEEIQILLEFLRCHLISTLKLTVLAGFFLNGVVGQMDVLVATVFQGKFEAGGAKVATWIEIGGYHGCGSH